MNLRMFFITTILLLNLSCISEETKYNIQKDKIYLIFRGNKTEKTSILVGKYNLVNQDISHVGILLYNNMWQVYHIYDTPNNSDIITDNISSFLENSDRKIIFQIDNINKTCILDKIETLIKKDTKFDKFFNLESDNKLYCSEFIVDIFNNCNVSTQNLMYTKKLPPLHATILKRDSLKYYPVDSFLEKTRGNIVYDKKLK